MHILLILILCIVGLLAFVFIVLPLLFVLGMWSLMASMFLGGCCLEAWAFVTETLPYRVRKFTKR